MNPPDTTKQLKKGRPAEAAPRPRTGRTLRDVGRQLADLVAAAAAEHKPIDPILLDLSGRSPVADWFFIASATGARQLTAIAEKIIRRARERGVRPLGLEGLGGDHWVLVDLGEVVVHLFNQEARALYDLEGLWTDAPRRCPSPADERTGL
ncbi:MAG: ribosome silencing factor [Candidatus Adiutrix sp.]|jgi:ribosome-associated protein|nr:ribosome silencing factor [Candidatus Adiutrix sp.]